MLDKIAQQTGTKLDIPGLPKGLNIDPGTIASYAGVSLSNALSTVGTVVGLVFGVFTFYPFTFYLSADGPRLRSTPRVAVPAPAADDAVMTGHQDRQLRRRAWSPRRSTRSRPASCSGRRHAVLAGAAILDRRGGAVHYRPSAPTSRSSSDRRPISLTPWLGLAALVALSLLCQQVENSPSSRASAACAVDIYPGRLRRRDARCGILFGAAGHCSPSR